MTIQEEIQTLKEQLIIEIEYYKSIDFPILQGKFQNVLEILNKIEEYMQKQEITREERITDAV